MSATSEKLLDEIRHLEGELTTLKESGGDTTDVVERLDDARKRFNAATEALNEGKGLLRG